MTTPKSSFIDGSRLIVESLARAGADVFIGYPITPANLLFQYSSQRFPAILSAPDEISALQWMAGWSAAGKLPVTATSFPGLALMIESINMAAMMELPMVIVLAQRLGPSTGSATVGAQGDILLLHGAISGGYPLPTLCIRDLYDCWSLPARAAALACRLRSPVVLLTSKEMVMTQQRFDLDGLPAIDPTERQFFEGPGPYESYRAGDDLVPPMLPVGSRQHQVRLNSSTHDARGIVQHASPEAMDNTRRLREKVLAHLPNFTDYGYDPQEGSDTLIVAFDVASQAAAEAASILRRRGRKVSLLLPATLLPVPEVYLDIMHRYARVVIAEENIDGQYRRILFGQNGRRGVSGVNAIGQPITPDDIVNAVAQ